MTTTRQLKEEKELAGKEAKALEKRVARLEKQVAELKEENGVMARILDAMTSDDEIKDEAPSKATPASMKKSTK